MATNRYGQIYHGDYHHINIRFPSTEARLKFQNEFEAYHQGHDHEGDIPTFISVSSKDLKLSTGSRSPQDLVKAETDENYRITIDGYSWNEIHDYHNPTGWNNYFWYHVPTCCVPPIIVVDHKFVDSGTLQRHELSAIFGDMSEQDYKSLLESVQRDGFIDDAIKLLDGQILDGWHRYRAAEELNLLRKLRFQVWDTQEHEDGDPKAFVLARNIERRHLSASQKAQIAVAFNERFGHGGDRSNVPDGTLKTRKELAEQVNVGERTISRAVAVEKAGQSEAVITGEKSAGEVLEAQKAEKKVREFDNFCNTIENLDQAWKDANLPISFEDDFLPAAADRTNFYPDTIKELYEAGKARQQHEEYEDYISWNKTFTIILRGLQERSHWVEALAVEAESEASDRGPRNTEEVPAEDEPDMNALWDAFNKRYPKWKAKYAESGYKENDLIQASTEAEMLDALRVYRESDRKGMPTADEVKDMTDLMSQQSYPFARCLRDLLRANSEKTESDAKTVADVLPGSEVLSIKVVCSGMKHFWFEDNSLTPDAIPLSCVPEEILVNLLMLTKDVKRLDVAAGEFVRAFGELGLGDSTMLYALERACTHYSCNLEELLMLTNLFPDRFDAEDAKTFRERMAAPHINAWINTLGSMKRDIESGENWMSGIKSGDYLS